MVAKQDKKVVAIYARKSSNEGLDTEFNTLDAQRLACEQFAASQVQEGWTVSPERYEDGGFSGGNTERPALTRLLEDVRAGKVQVIAVYKLDRLSRSLTDFVSLLQILDEHDVAFVSVTQHFNTATPMGRLMLHILICFAQFERENAIERIRDKVAATKRQGRWCGGVPPLGYDVPSGGRRLDINEAEAEQVREIYALYLEHRSIMKVLGVMQERGWHNKAWTTQKGKPWGGKPFSKSSLSRILTSILYTGRIAYQGEIIHGEHEHIIETEAWDEVQSILATQNRSGGHDHRKRRKSLLEGLLVCAHCDCGLVYTWTERKPNKEAKAARVYGYYSCHQAREQGSGACPMPNLPAEDTERLVIEEIAAICQDRTLAGSVVDQANAEYREARNEAKKAVTAAEQELGRCLAQQQKRNSQRARNALREAEANATVARENLVRIETQKIDTTTARRTLRNFDSIWAELSRDERRQLLRSLIHRVHIDGEKGTMRIDFASAGIAALASQGEDDE